MLVLVAYIRFNVVKAVQQVLGPEAERLVRRDHKVSCSFG